ncbi:MAG: ribosome assembly cofactor RimP [Flavobacteriales bacterium]
MISEELIRQLVNEKIEGTNYFLVEAKVNAGNKISVLVDGKEGIPISDIVGVSRKIEGSLDREKEDFELMVSSPGLDQPFKVLPQYLKYIGKKVEVKTGDGKKIQGVLISAEEEGIVLETSEKVKLEGKKKKVLEVKKHELRFGAKEASQRINECKVVITF